MAKTLVIESDERTRVPFLRGILTRSLQAAGLAFDDAYKLAAVVREELADMEQITTGALRERILKHLRKDHPNEIVQHYETPVVSAPMIMVQAAVDSMVSPFSRSQLQRNLESTGLHSEQSMAITIKVQQHLLSRGIKEINSNHLGHIVYNCLLHDIGETAAQRYLTWVDFLRSGRPLILLVGGTTGCGKSTIATALANQLEIVRTQSTDMLREVMRMMIPKRLIPVLHVSSFNAWEEMPHPEHAIDKDVLLEDGYRSQAELLSVPCEAVIQRSLRERTSLILEGVHVQPTLMDKIQSDGEAVIVPLMLAVLKPGQLRKRFRGRGGQVPQRRAERYLENFENIWALQSYLLSEADRRQVRILENSVKEQVVQEAMNMIVENMARSFEGTAKTVFGVDTKVVQSRRLSDFPG